MTDYQATATYKLFTAFNDLADAIDDYCNEFTCNDCPMKVKKCCPRTIGMRLYSYREKVADKW